MSKLCLGTFFTAITLCVSENSFKQGEDFGNVFGLLVHEYDPSPDLVSKFVRGVRNPSKAFINEVNRYEPDQYDELCFCMDDIANKFNNQSEQLLVKAISKIANGDETIPDNEIIDLVNGTMKKDLPGNYKNLSSFLTGIFLYVIKYVENVGMSDYVKEIDQLFIAEFIFEKQNKTKESSIVREATEDLKARQFMLTHEKERTLIPLCQVVYSYNPYHNYERNMFTDYNMLPQCVRRQILELCEATEMIEIDNLKWETGLSLFCDDLRIYDLSSDRYIYMFTQYFPNSCRYASYSISKYENFSFKRLYIFEELSHLSALKCCNLDTYIDDYLYIKENKINIDALKPMDYLWGIMNLESCPEEDVMYWLCRFIIDACNNLSYRITGKPMIVNCYDENAETIEDIFFSAVFALHRHYHFHNTVNM
ncbi:MAG: hypothetical protein J5786_05780 [Clostridiales bacterium]|nr:hypothetical protein [Clostridiales bacterium]